MVEIFGTDQQRNNVFSFKAAAVGLSVHIASTRANEPETNLINSNYKSRSRLSTTLRGFHSGITVQQSQSMFN